VPIFVLPTFVAVNLGDTEGTGRKLVEVRTIIVEIEPYAFVIRLDQQVPADPKVGIDFVEVIHLLTVLSDSGGSPSPLICLVASDGHPDS
jgi:hypothetical protein